MFWSLRRLGKSTTASSEEHLNALEFSIAIRFPEKLNLMIIHVGHIVMPQTKWEKWNFDRKDTIMETFQ